MPTQPSKPKHPRFSSAPSRQVVRWSGPAVLLAIALLYLLLSDSRSFGPTWFPPVVLGLAGVAAVLAERQGAHRMRRRLVLGANAVATLSLIVGTGLLIYGLASTDEGPFALLRDALLLWTLNILTFALWYWEIDNGGPQRRFAEPYRSVDFLFPQKQLDQSSTWLPGFIDYLFLAFNTNTAFSPTDTLVLSRSAKLAMMVQSMISLVVIAVIVARGVSALQS